METKMVLAFDDEDPKFARGFEAGRIWGILSRIEVSKGLEVDVSKENAEMMLRMGEAKGRSVHTEDLEDEELEGESTHMTVKFSPAVEYEKA